MDKKKSIFENQKLLHLVDEGKASDELILSFGIIRHIDGIYENYTDMSSGDVYELCRENVYTRGIIETTDKHNRKVKKYCINGNRRRYQQYHDAHRKYNKVV